MSLALGVTALCSPSTAVGVRGNGAAGGAFDTIAAESDDRRDDAPSSAAAESERCDDAPSSAAAAEDDDAAPLVRLLPGPPRLKAPPGRTSREQNTN